MQSFHSVDGIELVCKMITGVNCRWHWLQAMKTETIPFLVGLLETGLEAVDNMAATKAQIVKALKAMQLSLKYGDQVTSLVCCWNSADLVVVVVVVVAVSYTHLTLPTIYSV